MRQVMQTCAMGLMLLFGTAVQAGVAVQSFTIDPPVRQPALPTQPPPPQQMVAIQPSDYQASPPATDANADSVGAIAAQYQIDPSGAATYSVPLYVPTGSANVQPALSLNYSSRGSNGPLGVGWSIGGLSVISRCKKGTEFGDGVGPFPQPNFDATASNDAYCLDGARLLPQTGAGTCPVSGVNAGNAQAFGLELDTTTLVCGYTPNTANGLVGYSYWLVEPADGSIRRYGFAGSSALPRNANGVSVSPVDSYLSWSLDRQADRSGNTIDFSYQRDAANGELEISHIDYTGKVDLSALPTMGANTRAGGNFAAVTFNYETMPSTGQRIDYLSGMKLALTHRLASVAVTGPSNYPGNSVLTTVHTYHLSYTDSLTSGVSTLTKLQECAPNGASEVCYPATSFGWNSNNAPGFTLESFGGLTNDPFAAAVNFKVGNIAGNGTQSVVFIEDRACGPSYSGARFRIRTTIASTGQLLEIGSPIDYPLTSSRPNIPSGCGDTTAMHLENTYALYDVTGDGLDDLIVLTATGWKVYPNNGNGFDTTPAHIIDTGIGGTASDDGKLVDLFGDGLPALMHGLAGSTFSARHLVRNSVANPAYKFATTDVPVDFDIPTDIPVGATATVGINSNNSRVLAAGDIDGNGAADLIMRVQLASGGSNIGKRWYVYRNLGVQASGHLRFAVDEDLEPAGSAAISDDGNDVQFVDFAGNGQSGVMYQVPVTLAGVPSQEIHYRLNIGKPDESAAGSRFGSDNGAVITLPTARAKRVQVMDINQDHKADLVYFDKPSSASNWPLEANLFGTTGFGPVTQLCSLYCNNGINADNTLSLFLDGNGDGQPMLYRFQGSNFGTGTNTLQGIAPDTLATITNGFGARTTLTYAPLTVGTLYQRSYNSAAKTWGRGSPVFDLFGPFWVVGSAQSSAPTDDASAGNTTATTTSALVTYQYSAARIQSGGRGFLGFGQVSSTDKQASSDGTYDVQTQTTYRQDFPYIGRPGETVVTLVPHVGPDPCIANPNGPGCHPCKVSCPIPPSTPTVYVAPLLTDSVDSWTTTPAFDPAVVQSLAVYRYDSNEQHFDLATQAFSHMTDTAITSVDSYGNPLETTVISTHADASTGGNSVTDETLTTSNIYGCTASPPTIAACTTSDAERQRLGRLSLSTVTSTRPSESQTRRVSFEYDATTYQLYSEIQGPYNDLVTDAGVRATLGLRTDYTLDSSGNRIQTVQCSTADFATRSACQNLSGFVQQQYASLTKVQRYSKTVWEPLGRFPFGTLAPYYWPTAAAGTEQYSQAVGINPDGHGGFWVYRDAYGNPADAVDANGIVTLFSYGLMGRKTFASSYTGAFSTTSYMWCTDASAADIPSGAPRANCPLGAVYQMIDAAVISGTTALRPTVYSYYDILGRLVLKTVPMYQSSGTLGKWSSTATVYDTDGRVVKTTVPYFSIAPSTAQGATADTRAGYPEAGITTLPAAEKATYDAIGRPLDESHPEQSGNGASDTIMTYDRTASTLKNPRAYSSTSLKNGRAETVQITDPAGLVVKYNKGAFGTTTSVARTPTDGGQAGLQVANYLAFDRLGRKTAISDPDKGYWTYSYNALGEQVSQTDAKGQKQTLTRDALGRLIKRVDLRSDGSTEQLSSWTYDTTILSVPPQSVTTRYGLGLIASETSSLDGFTKNTSYDLYGRVASIATTLDGTTYTESQTYDSYSRSLAHTDATATGGTAGETIGYSTEGYAIQLTDGIDGNGALLDQILAMSPRGQTSQEQYGGSAAMTTHRTFDPVTGRLTQLISGTSGAIQNWTYIYDKHTNLISRWNQATGFDQKETFTYDDLDRLTDQTLTRLNAVTLNAALVHLAYDGLGNITSKSGVGAYTYATRQSGCANAAGVHAATLVGTSQRYCYDANGNQTGAIGTTTRSIAYTAYDLPAQIIQTTPTATEIDFKYAPDRSLWKRTDGVSPAVPGSGPECAANSDRIYCNGFEAGSTGTVPAGGGGTPTYYVGNIEIIGTGASATIKRYVGSFLVVTGTAANPNATYNYLFKDSIGSVDVITNASGVATQRESFDPHGLRRNLQPTNTAWALLTPAQLASYPTTTTRESFTGHWGLEAVGLIHMGGRLYDATLGRFIQADPFTERDASQGLNRYSYVLNNPLSLTDPTGYMSFGQWIGAAIGIVAGIASGGLYTAGMYLASFAVAVGGGFVSAYIASGFNANAGLWGAFAAGVFWGIGSAFQQVAKGNVGAGGMVGNTHLTYGQFAAKAAVHGIAGGVLNSLRGANFGNGFWAAGATAALSPQIDRLGDNVVGKVAAAALIGGTVSAATGGKFSNGAETGAFQEIFNSTAHPKNIPINEAELGSLANGNLPGFWQSRYDRGDPWAPDALSIWDPGNSAVSDYDRSLGQLTLTRLAGNLALRDDPDFDIAQISHTGVAGGLVMNYGDEIHQIGMEIAGKYAAFVDDNSGAIPSTGDAINYHNSVFSSHGLPASTYGATPFGNIFPGTQAKLINDIVGYCRGCPE